MSRLVPQSPSDQLLAERMPVRLTNTAHPAFGFYSTGISWFSHLIDSATLGQRPFSPSAVASLGDLPSPVTRNMFQDADSLYYQPTVNLLQEQLWSAFRSQGRSFVCICCRGWHTAASQHPGPPLEFSHRSYLWQGGGKALVLRHCY